MTGEKEVSNRESSMMSGFVSLFGVFDLFGLSTSKSLLNKESGCATILILYTFAISNFLLISN
jgi:hypothetical protein